ncbi:hypothetical protein [Pelomonas aquatica]|jgi:hypothetical protein|uniref:Lipoprotein n=1 Tax=Pelomonas aquatica TaxID=431058 RepID=A0A9X4LI18_9BURK|nr:hypothetical protein [Pelomonas aquatica]MCY4753104.1 hypothetical protein [Pelomonas aquatica]MDG0862832.1 hypothetical protein [Pelomonas aquatica]
MRAAATALAAALLAGCAAYQGFQPATPDGYDGPTVNVADQTVQVSGSLVHVFEMTRVDGRRLLSTSIATLQANQGRGFGVAPVALSNELPPGPARVRLQAVTQYAAPILAMTNPTCRVEGDVAFAPEADHRYRVAGRITAAECMVWIEDATSGHAVTEKVSGKGTGS